MIVGNNSQLESAATSTNASAVRLGFQYPGDAESLTYMWSSTSCSAPDYASQVPSNTGGCWKAQLPAKGVDAREWGSLSTNVASALAWAAAYSQKLVFPPGTYLLPANLSVSVPQIGSITIEGMGSDVTILEFPSGSDGFSITVDGVYSTFHIRDLTIATKGTPSSTPHTVGLNLIQGGNVSGPAPNVPGNTAQSDIVGVTFRGADGYTLSDGWYAAVSANAVSNINFISDYFVSAGGGNPGVNYVGTGISLGGGSQIGVGYNVSGSTFLDLTYGINYGSNAQGLTVTGGTNLVGNTSGIYVPPGATGTAELILANSQCGYNEYCVNDDIGVFGELISNNLIATNYSSSLAGVGVQTICAGCTITDNVFSVFPISPSGTRGVYITGGTGGVISGNTFTGANDNGTTYPLTTAIEFAPAISGMDVYGNHYGITTYNVSSASAPSNIITGGGIGQAGNPAPAWAGLASVSGAICTHGSPNIVELTVNSAAPFVTGQMVLVSGVGGLSYVSSGVVTPITVLNSTQMTLNNVLCSGAYTSGGIVSDVPP